MESASFPDLEAIEHFQEYFIEMDYDFEWEDFVF